MDPVTGALLSAASGEVVKRSLAAVTSPWTASQRVSEDGWNLLSVPLLDADNSTEIIGVITHEQAAQIGAFIRSHEVCSIMQARLLVRIGMIKKKEGAEVIKHLCDAFSALAGSWCEAHQEQWVSLALDIWTYLTRYLDSILPSDKVNFFLSADERSRLSLYVAAPALGAATPLPAFIRQMISAVKSPQRMASIDESLADLCRGAQAYYKDMSLAHAREGNRYDFDELYIHRRLTSAAQTESWDSDQVLNIAGAIPRCVVVGDPGVGKSTLVRHLVKSLAEELSSENERIAPLVFRCREFSSTAGSTYLVELIGRTIKDDLQQEIATETLEDILAMGRGFLIFDGLDEVTDISRRQQLVKAISTLAARFPLAPILVTSRRVGYRRAAFDSKEFTLFELDEYSKDQVTKYAQKWFKLTKQKDEEAAAFLRESSSVGDLRTNPLMLSLLCALYRARGYIPRNRLQIYRSCADLLFVRWDSMRHIEQPFDHKAYGQRLMQELAYFYYKNQSAQGGVEERQLEKITANFFEDTTAVEKSEARTKAQNFLDFCADRAWLLSSQGTGEYGDRIFGFTHRTFMEYFAAEAIVRRATVIDDIADEVAKAYDRDPSSVLADVIVQCADEGRDRGAEYVIKNLLSRSTTLSKSLEYRYLPLCLRIVNSAVVNKRIMDEVFERLLSYWSETNPDDSFDTSVALFELYRDPRARFMYGLRSELEASDSPKRTISVLARWSRLHLLDMSGDFDIQVADTMRNLLEVSIDKFFELTIRDWCIFTYALDIGVVTPQNIEVARGAESPLLILPVFKEIVPGSFLRSLERAIWPTSEAGSQEVLQWASERVLARTQLSVDEAYQLSNVAREMARAHRSLDASQLEGSELRQAAYWICCALYEVSTPSLHPFHDVVDAVVGLEVFRKISITRISFMGVAEEPSWIEAMKQQGYSHVLPYSRRQVKEVLSDLPEWAKRWAVGNFSIVKFV